MSSITPINSVVSPDLVAAVEAATFQPLATIGQTQDQTTTTDVLANADALNLSPFAQALLEQNGSVASPTGGFLLTDAQQLEFDAIIQKYQDQPYNQENFNHILDDLRAAGLAPEQLAVKDMLQSVDPTASLLDNTDTTENSTADILNTALPTSPLVTTLPNEQANIAAYTLQILSQWQGLSIVG